MLRFENVDKSYGSRAVLQGRTGCFAPGAYALRGPNGIGKSTLLRVLAGVDEADGGDIVIDGLSLRAQPAAAKARLSYAPDECPVYPFVTGRELLAFVAWAKRCAISDKVAGIVERFGLGRHLDTRCGAMSLGTQKKLMLAAAWIGDPVVLLLDEPSNGLDANTRAELVDLLAAQRDTSVVFMSTHDKAFAEAVGAAGVEFETLTAPQAAGNARRSGMLAAMSTDSDIELSGPFQARDGNGRTLDVKAIRIHDEGYGIIDVYVEFAARLDPGAYKDPVLVRAIIDRLRAVGYKGPDFAHGDPGLQESRLVVLEAPEEFAPFAKSRGWKNLAEDFDD